MEHCANTPLHPMFDDGKKPLRQERLCKPTSGVFRPKALVIGAEFSD
jgi:hypothetical protein